MIQILVCEENPDDQQQLIHFIQKTFSLFHIPFTIICYEPSISSLQSFDLIFIDARLFYTHIQSIREQLHQYHRQTPVILTSRQNQCFHQGYIQITKGYLKKPYSFPVFQETIQQLIEYHFKEHHFLVDFKISPYRLYLKDLLYVEFAQRHSYLYMTHKKYRTTYPLNHWRTLLSSYEFGQPYKAFLVNFQHICGFSSDKKDIYLSNGQKVPLSKKYRPSFLHDYFRYMKSTH